MKRSEILFVQQNLDTLPVVNDFEYNLVILQNKKTIDSYAERYKKVLRDGVSPFYLECVQKLSASPDKDVKAILGNKYEQYTKENEDFLKKQAEFLDEDEAICLRRLDSENLPEEVKKANLAQSRILQYFI